MPTHFIITKVLPSLAIIAIYWLGSLDLPNIIFLPIALTIAIIIFYLARKYGDKKEETNNSDKK